MGAADDSVWKKILPIPVDGDWIQPTFTIAAVAIAAYLAYKMVFGNVAKNRKKELAEARKAYGKRVAEIKEKWAY